MLTYTNKRIYMKIFNTQRTMLFLLLLLIPSAQASEKIQTNY